MSKLKLIGGLMGVLALVLAWVIYDGFLALIIMLAIWGNNMERFKPDTKEDKAVEYGKKRIKNEIFRN